MNKLAVITGGSRGLGRAAAIGVAQRGTDVVLTYVFKADEAQAVVKEVEKLGRKAVALRLDVGDAKTFPQFAETLKRELKHFDRSNFDYLLNNAGHGVTRRLPKPRRQSSINWLTCT